MDKLRLAYRDNDRTPVIFCIREMARRHYDIDVEALRIQDNAKFESAIFEDGAEVLIEHTEYLYGEPYRGRNVTMFVAPCITTDLYFMVSKDVTEVEQLVGGTVAIRGSGRPHSSMLELRSMGLDGRVNTVIVPDSEVGRWGQYKKVTSGECGGAFMTTLYLPPALAAGLHVLHAPEVEVIGHFAQACTTSFASGHADLMDRYIRANVHALCFLKLQRQAAMEIVAEEPARLMKIDDGAELERFVEAIVPQLQLKPYPTPQAVANTYESAVAEYPGAEGQNPLAIWDLHWVKQVDDSGFIDGLIQSMSSSQSDRH